MNYNNPDPDPNTNPPAPTPPDDRIVKGDENDTAIKVGK
jgi:hypothetical protein